MPKSTLWLSLFIEGTPIPQGSKRIIHTREGKPIIIEDNNKTRPWRRLMTQAIKAHMVEHPCPPSEKIHSYILNLTFWLPRPKSVTEKKRLYPCVKPDLDKLLRAVNDSLTDSGVIRDDAQIIKTKCLKIYANEDKFQPGVLINLERLE